MATLFDYLPGVPVSFDHRSDESANSRFEQIAEHYEARTEALEEHKFGGPPYKPVPPERMFLDAKSFAAAQADRPTFRLTPFEEGEGPNVRSWRGRGGRTFAAERQQGDVNVFDAVVGHIRRLQGEPRRVIVTAWTPGARERLATLLSDHGLKDVTRVESYAEALALPAQATAIGVLGIEQGFETPEIAVIGEQDILGDRLVRPRRKQRSAVDVLTEATSLSVGDLVVHADHGIGRFFGLKTITVLKAPHDCLELHYAGGDKLFLPVENIELLSRYGADESDAQLDRLGGVAWQSRKAKLKKRLREIASELIKIAALRQLKEAPSVAAPEGAYDEFVARFPYEETEDQDASIEAVLGDLSSGRPMDRLVCGDVGFGKTEVALRAAFVAAMNGLQVAVVVPTTLLSRQHYKTFTERFKGLPIRIAQASRLVGTAALAEAKEGLANGSIDVVVGTHALLGKSIDFKRLGLLVIDEEQHFGVTHKERLKKMREDVHVLTLSATPIPRTLQLALTGVRELSLITTPPVDRLAVRTYISPFDPMIIRDALRRERYRGGQSFYVAPRIADLDEIADFLREAVPELTFARATGQLAPSELEDVMTAFYDGKYDVLLSTAIVESGLDLPNANTLIVHRADMFGLAQLYQLRGRVGRSKARAYAYFTIPVGKALSEAADKRLKVLQSLDTLGAGFSLASHDLDIRGAGNLLGEEQSGHIREVGFELYQSMLEEAVASMKGGDLEGATEQWSPTISLGTSVLIPETLRRRPATPPRPLPPPVDAGDARGDRRLRVRAGRPLRPAARGGRASARRHGDQGAVPPGGRRPGGCGAARRRRRLLSQRVRQPGRPRAVRAVLARAPQGAARPEARLSRRVGSAGRALEGRARLHRPARRRRRQGEEGGLRLRSVFFLKKAREGVGRRPRSSGAIGSIILIACQKMIGKTMTRNRPMPIRSFISVRKPR